MADVKFPAIGRADFTGRLNIGAISVPGLKVGDLITFISFNSAGFDVPNGGKIESVVSVNDEIQQTANVDWTGVPFTILFLRSV